MPKRVLRLTRHKASEKQMGELRAAFGDDVEVIDVKAPAPDQIWIRELTHNHEADAVEVVLPIHLLRQITGRGGLDIPVLRAVMSRVEESGNIIFTFDHYDVIERVEVITRPLIDRGRTRVNMHPRSIIGGDKYDEQ